MPRLNPFPTISWTLFIFCYFEFLLWTLPLVSANKIEPAEQVDYGHFLDQHQQAYVGLGEVAKGVDKVPTLQEPTLLEENFPPPEANSGASQGPTLLTGVLALGLAANFLPSSPRNRGSAASPSVPAPKKKKSPSVSTKSVGVLAAPMAVGLLTLSRRSQSLAGQVARRISSVPVRPIVQNQIRAFSFSTSQINHQSAAASAAVSPRQTVDLSQISIPQLRMDVDPTPEELRALSNEQLVQLIQMGKVAEPKLETLLGDFTRAVEVRRLSLLSKTKMSPESMQNLAYDHYNYEHVHGVCCENVLGYVQIPVGVVGPLKINGKDTFVPMATTEGCLVASTQRGSKAISVSGGVTAMLLKDGMTRAPLLRTPSVRIASEIKSWVESAEGFKTIAAAFESSSRFAKLDELKVTISGRNCHLRFKSKTGDAMGMNMISKGCERALALVTERFPESEVMSLSGNMCTDKKPSAINWIEGRGKSVVAEATIKKEVVQSVLKTTVDALIDINTNKNLVGSIMAGSVGGFNAHAANIVTAVYLACGQDPAQNVESSTCLTLMEKNEDGDLYMTVTMPSIEVGTVGGGTSLPGQAACLDIMGVKGAAPVSGANAQQLALNVASTVMCGELSLLSALAAGHLVRAHMQHNRKKQ